MPGTMLSHILHTLIIMSMLCCGSEYTHFTDEFLTLGHLNNLPKACEFWYLDLYLHLLDSKMCAGSITCHVNFCGGYESKEHRET